MREYALIFLRRVLVSSLVEKYREVSPETALEEVVRGEVELEREKNLEKAADHFERALRLEPENLDAISLRGYVYYLVEDFGNAILFLKRILGLLENPVAFPFSSTVHNVIKGLYYLGLCFGHVADYENYLIAFQKLLSVSLAEKDRIPVDSNSFQLVERVMLLLPSVYFRLNDRPGSIRALRSSILSGFPNTPWNRLRLFHALAEILLLKTSAEQYPPLDMKMRSQKADSFDGFIPTNLLDESLLCSFVAESLSFSPNLNLPLPLPLTAIQLTLRKEITLSFAHQRNFPPIVSIYEKHIPFDHSDQSSAWFLFGLALYSSNQFKESLFAFQQCNLRNPNDFQANIWGAKICVNHLPHLFQEGISMARSAVTILLDKITHVERKDSKYFQRSYLSFLSKAYHLLGLSYYLSSRQENSTKEKREAHLLALEALHNAYDCHPFDSEILFHLSLQYAEIRDLARSSSFLQQSLRISKAHSPSWILLVLVLSAQQLIEKAIEVCDMGISFFPEEIIFLLLKVKLYQSRGKYGESLSYLRKAMELLRRQEDSKEEAPLTEDLDIRSADDGFKEGGAQAGEGKKSRVRKMTSYEGPPTLELGLDVQLGKFFSTPNHGFELLNLQDYVDKSKELKVNLWKFAAEIYFEASELASAKYCLTEAHKVCPHAPDVLAFEVLLKWREGQPTDLVVEAYRRILLLHPENVDAKLNLAHLLFETADFVAAENLLTSLVRRDPTNYRAWFLLGSLFSQRKDIQHAAECFSTSLQLEATTPILPFSTLNIFV